PIPAPTPPVTPVIEATTPLPGDSSARRRSRRTVKIPDDAVPTPTPTPVYTGSARVADLSFQSSPEIGTSPAAASAPPPAELTNPPAAAANGPQAAPRPKSVPPRPPTPVPPPPDEVNSIRPVRIISIGSDPPPPPVKVDAPVTNGTADTQAPQFAR